MSAESHPSLPANRLSLSASSYLRSAAHQPVDWYPWGEEAFARAQREDKPILLDIGAVWCHWCHVMDGESYEDAAVAAVINEHFVAVKVDRDERPDVDTRYQSAISSITGQGGWPLTGFLAPDGRPYFGGTYIPRHSRYGRAGIVDVLRAMAEVWKSRREEALETAAQVMTAIEHNENFFGQGDFSISLASAIAAAALERVDDVQGGFGEQPKFPHSAALDLLLDRAVTEDDAAARRAFRTTLEKMGRGGVYDQLAGGFHRYSVDAIWRVPHFEKMLYDNTELLRNYVHGYQSFALPEFAERAREIMAWLDDRMTDRERGGFYASQDADVGLEDDGDYFTWTLDEARAVVTPAELAFATEYWGIAAVGDMHHNPAKNVLHVDRTLEEMTADESERQRLRGLRDAVRTKLLAARQLRPEPFIDRTLYTGWNAMAVRAYLEAAQVLRDEQARGFALKTLDRILAEAWDGESLLRHVVAYPVDIQGAVRSPGTLDDYAFLLQALIEGWAASGEIRYYRTALQMADAAIALFYDRTACVFRDTAEDGKALGVLKARRTPLQDTPTPAANPVIVSALLRLAELGERRNLRELAEDTLESFAGVATHFGLFAASYALAVLQALRDPIQIVIVGKGQAAEEMLAVAFTGYGLHKTVLQIDARNLHAEALPTALADTLLQVPVPAATTAWALVCKGHSCLPPVTTAEALRSALLPS